MSCLQIYTQWDICCVVNVWWSRLRFFRYSVLSKMTDPIDLDLDRFVKWDHSSPMKKMHSLTWTSSYYRDIHYISYCPIQWLLTGYEKAYKKSLREVGFFSDASKQIWVWFWTWSVSRGFDCNHHIDQIFDLNIPKVCVCLSVTALLLRIPYKRSWLSVYSIMKRCSIFCTNLAVWCRKLKCDAL